MFEVVPLKGVGPVLLKMGREESRAAMGIQPETFRKTVDSAMLTDSYYDSAFQVFFDDRDEVEYIELSSGGPISAIYKGISLFEIAAADLVEFLANDAPYDRNDPELGYSYIFPNLELSLWRPVLPENDEDEEGQYFSTVGIGTKGYYSKRTV